MKIHRNVRSAQSDIVFEAEIGSECEGQDTGTVRVPYLARYPIARDSKPVSACPSVKGDKRETTWSANG